MVQEARVVIPPHLHGSSQLRSKGKNPLHFAPRVFQIITMFHLRFKTLLRLFLFALIRGAFRFAKKYDMPTTIKPSHEI
jgi:hypothetical protein